MTWVLVIVVALILIYAISKVRTDTERKWSKEKTYLQEEVIHVVDPIRMTGKPDKVIIKNGQLVVIDVKSVVDSSKTPRIYDTHRMQLSVYGYILRHTQERQVSRFGYIRFSGAVNMDVKVALYDDTYVESAYERYNELINREVIPDKRNDKACARCRYQVLCD